MAYRFTRKERMRDGVRRVVSEQIDKAIAELTNPDLSRDDAVHQARKRFKKIRAVLRLVRPEIGNTYSEENTFYRDAGGALSATRDAQAVLECLAKLHTACGDDMEKAAHGRIAKGLTARRDAIAESAAGLDAQVGELVGQLEAAKARTKAWPVPNRGFETLSGGLKTYYACGRKAMKTAYGNPSDENFHEWRKRVKDHWYHGRLLHGIWPDLMKGHRRSLKKLSELLGDYHDLMVLRQTLADEPEYFPNQEDVAHIRKLAKKRQASLRETAHPLGGRVYAEKPSKFTKRWGQYWQAWRGR